MHKIEIAQNIGYGGGGISDHFGQFLAMFGYFYPFLAIFIAILAIFWNFSFFVNISPFLVRQFGVGIPDLIWTICLNISDHFALFLAILG